MDFIRKLYILYVCLYDGLSGGLQYWKSEIYPHDLDDWECCNGGTGYQDICGCGEKAIRETWFNKIANQQQRRADKAAHANR